jgi:transcription-repair coupling factor (superfamily II helicase)
LYVPIHQADRLSKYIGSDERPPALHRLGTTEWDHVKTRAQAAAAEVARELLDLYARRQLAEGYAFKTDTAWQSELEGGFPFEETEDQKKAIEEVKRDMEGLARWTGLCWGTWATARDTSTLTITKDTSWNSRTCRMR